MIKKYNYLNLFIWVMSFQFIGFIMGEVTRSNIETWYVGLKKSSLTPPNYIFPIAWIALYFMISIAGWLLWSETFVNDSKKLKTSKICYILQITLNWLWSPLFFYYHVTGLALFCIMLMIVFTFLIIYKVYNQLPTVSILLVPYLLWSSFACYLNFYIWFYN